MAYKKSVDIAGNTELLRKESVEAFKDSSARIAAKIFKTSIAGKNFNGHYGGSISIIGRQFCSWRPSITRARSGLGNSSIKLL
jgi:hypothetical protein